MVVLSTITAGNTRLNRSIVFEQELQFLWYMKESMVINNAGGKLTQMWSTQILLRILDNSDTAANRQTKRKSEAGG